jgi:hypothetical protein
LRSPPFSYGYYTAGAREYQQIFSRIIQFAVFLQFSRGIERLRLRPPADPYAEDLRCGTGIFQETRDAIFCITNFQDMKKQLKNGY